MVTQGVPPTAAAGGESATRGPLRDAFLFFLLALSVAVTYVLTDAEPLFWDEYYHLLPGRSWAFDGSLTLGDGVYGRAAWLSIAVGWIFRTFGERIVYVRVAAALVTAAWSAGVFVWTRREAGRPAAWAAGLLFCLAPMVLINATMIRFYGVAGLLTGAAAFGIYTLVRPDRVPDWRVAVPLLVGTVVCLRTAYLITPLAGAWIAGVVPWAVGMGLVAAARSRRRGTALLVGVSAAGLAGIVLALAWRSGFIEEAWAFYRQSPGWSAVRAGDFRWYEHMIESEYPLLWILLPLAAIVALTAQPRFASFCLTVFVFGLAILSGGGPKAERYALPVMPWFFMLWGVAAASLWPIVRGAIDRFVRTFLDGRAPAPLARLGVPAVSTVVVGFILLTNPGTSQVLKLPAGHLRSIDRAPSNLTASPSEWDRLAPLLRPIMDEVEVVVTANGLQSLYHVGNYDVEMRASVVGELRPPTDFTVDPRTGRPAISRLASLQSLIERNESGLIFGERRRWGNSADGFPPDVVAWVSDHLEPVPLPPGLGVRAYRWGPPAGG
jgi:hypothetical protein